MVHELRGLCPGTGCYKLWLMLQDMCPDIKIGRDRFYRLMHIEHLVLKPLRRRHTTDSNHNYRKYKNLLKEGFRPSAPNQLWVADITYVMTEDYCPTDNALAERVNGIIKQEWLYRMKRPKGTREARELIRGIVDFYNNRRPHMSIGMKTPAQMRAESLTAA